MIVAPAFVPHLQGLGVRLSTRASLVHDDHIHVEFSFLIYRMIQMTICDGFTDIKTDVYGSIKVVVVSLKMMWFESLHDGCAMSFERHCVGRLRSMNMQKWLLIGCALTLGCVSAHKETGMVAQVQRQSHM